jgi:alcohol dehydrogenase class IV
MHANDVDEVVAKSARASSMKANPITLTTEELKGVYLSSL